MNMPGFAAEASLIQTSERYPMSSESAHAAGVIPSAVSDRLSSSFSELISPRLCWAYRCHWVDVSPGAPFPPRIVWHCGFEWIC